MNEYDSNRLADLLKKTGYERTEDPDDIDCYILNTCHIREKATEKVYHDVGRLKKSYKNKKNPIVIVTGCVAQAENNEMLDREPYIDAVVGPQSYQNIPKILQKIKNRKKNKLNLTNFDVIEKFDSLNDIKNSNSKTSSFITIQEGCDKFCNFCVVPYTRGPEYSRSVKEIVKEAKELVSNGVSEITLLGQNVNAYSFIDNNVVFKLSDLIFELENIKDLLRIRYTTSHPNDMTADLIQCHKKSKKLVPFVHLPVQSGSNKILKTMNRKHTREEYLAKINDLISVRPEIRFSSDFIVGYPGETEKDFSDTISLVKQIKFLNSFSFIYNKRPGTPTSKQILINEQLQKKRLTVLQNLLSDIQIKENNNQVGKLKKVLIENKMKNQTNYFGRLENFTPVIIEKVSNSDIGKIINVRIDDFNKNNLFGIKENMEGVVAA